MKTYQRIITTAVTAAFLFGFIRPQEVKAGDQEWAVAGKVLTGIVAANVFTDAFRPRRSTTYRTGYRQSSYRDQCDAPRVRYRNKRSRQNRFDRPEKSWYPGNNWKQIAKRRTSSEVCDDDYLIVKIENGRRIIQQRTRGATAYIQVYSDVCGKWVTLREYPSIW